MENQTQTQTETQTQSTKSLFQLLEEANGRNVEARKPSILGTSQDMLANTVAVVAGALESLAKGTELANSYISEELDRQVACRTETKVDSTVRQFEAIARLTQLGATPSDAINLATSYRR